MSTVDELKQRYEEGIDVTKTDPRALFKCIQYVLLNPKENIQDDVIFLIDKALVPVHDPDNNYDLVYSVINQKPFKGQATIARMLVAAGAPTTHKARDCANSKFDGLWNMLFGTHEYMTYTGPVSLMQTPD